MADGGVGGYLTMNGIAGTSKDPNHRNSIEVLSFSFYPPKVRPPQGIIIVKLTDFSSVMLASAASYGKSVGTAVLEWWTRGVLQTDSYVGFDGPPSLDFLKLTMIGAMITEFNQSSNLDTVMISFDKMQTASGSIPAPQAAVRPQHRHLIPVWRANRSRSVAA